LLIRGVGALSDLKIQSIGLTITFQNQNTHQQVLALDVYDIESREQNILRYGMGIAIH
jgi:hypothetical protein